MFVNFQRFSSTELHSQFVQRVFFSFFRQSDLDRYLTRGSFDPRKCSQVEGLLEEAGLSASEFRIKLSTTMTRTRTALNVFETPSTGYLADPAILRPDIRIPLSERFFHEYCFFLFALENGLNGNSI